MPDQLLASHALLFPGPLPPLSHLGVTLLRHALGSGLRYALYQLGLPLPEAAPVRVVRLRPYLDAAKLQALLAGAPGGPEVAAALLDPAGAGALPAEARALRAAVGFHRLRLRFAAQPLSGRARVARRLEEQVGKPWRLWDTFRGELSRLLPRVHDALLADLVATLDRRAARARGETVPPVVTPAVRRLLAGRRMDLTRFGVPDLMVPTWKELPELAEAARAAHAREPLPPSHPLRGRCRESWRALMSHLAPTYRALAATAAARGLLATAEDAYFLPFDVAEVLAADGAPSWLVPAVASNRAEYEAWQRNPAPPDLLFAEPPAAAASEPAPEWASGGVLPIL